MARANRLEQIEPGFRAGTQPVLDDHQLIHAPVELLRRQAVEREIGFDLRLRPIAREANAGEVRQLLRSVDDEDAQLHERAAPRVRPVPPRDGTPGPGRAREPPRNWRGGTRRRRSVPIRNPRIVLAGICVRHVRAHRQACQQQCPELSGLRQVALVGHDGHQLLQPGYARTSHRVGAARDQGAQIHHGQHAILPQDDAATVGRSLRDAEQNGRVSENVQHFVDADGHASIGAQRQDPGGGGTFGWGAHGTLTSLIEAVPAGGCVASSNPRLRRHLARACVVVMHRISSPCTASDRMGESRCARTSGAGTARTSCAGTLRTLSHAIPNASSS